MKRILSVLLLSALLSITLAGCAEKAENTSSTIVQVSSQEEKKPAADVKIKDGTYSIVVSSDSSMFKITDAQLIVKDGEMTSVLTLSGTGYEKLYMGTAEQALEDSDDNCIYFVEDSDGKYTYTVPVEVLDKDTACAAWSIKNQEWYERILVFKSENIPAEAFID